MTNIVNEHARQWTGDDSVERYTATQGSCQGLVWHESTGGWKALVSRHDVDTTRIRLIVRRKIWTHVD